MSANGPRRSAGKTLLAAWRRFCYRLTYHTCLAISLKRWAWLWVALPPLAAWWVAIPTCSAVSYPPAREDGPSTKGQEGSR